MCPDCQQKTEIRDRPVCGSCGRIFSPSDGVLDLLPRDLGGSDVSSENLYAGWARNSVAASPLNVLLHKADYVLYFSERILPDLRLHGKILEIGSGPCWLSALLKLKSPDAYVVATDISRSALAMGIRIDQFLRSKIDCFAACKIERLPFEDGFFDYVVGSAVLHQTNLHEAAREIFRVLDKGGSYIGMAELAIPRGLGALWSSRFGYQGKTARKTGVTYRNYSLKSWMRHFRDAGFKEVLLETDRDPAYKHRHWSINLYYSMLRRLPEPLVRRCFAFSLDIRANKG